MKELILAFLLVVLIVGIVEICILVRMWNLLELEEKKKSAKYIKKCSMCKNILPIDMYYKVCPYCGKDFESELKKHDR